ncbi:MAG TPA: primary-amine oxidase [Solirubrobacteraceae bacterium]|nr:primary-amine oxidase [Solirubrobacteraceae bacterium]
MTDATIVPLSEQPSLGRHPLEPLSAEEIRRAVAILRGERRLAETVRFSTVELLEPPKADVLAWPEAGQVERQAFVIVMDRADGAVHEAVVSLDAEALTSWTHLPGVQPRIMAEEFVECEEMLKRHPEYLAALAKRGITDPSLLMIDPWSAGGELGVETRLCRALAWVRSEEGDNGYARPVEGLIAFVDLNKMEVVRIEDHGVTPLPPEEGNYTPTYVGELRDDLRPIEITQPEGPSFTVDGHEIRWQKWRLRIGFTAREGLVLHDVGYEDGERLRPVMYRGSFSEMVVPYGEVAPTHVWKNAFDIGEYGIGALANSLELGCDCLGEIRYFDAVLCDAAGEPLVLRNAVCLHEEDASLLWKHVDWRTGETEVRRNRRLVISFVATVGNYEYGYYWYFQQDGAIEVEVKLTGIVSTGAVAPGEPAPYATMVAPGLTAPYHQHYFNVRLDMMVDGPRNSVVEVNTAAEPQGPENPWGNAFRPHETVLASERQSGRMIDPSSARYWKIVNPSVRNGLGAPVAYKLEPGGNAACFVHPDSSVAKRAGFITGHVWVTPYDPSERFAAGEYPNQSPGGDGLPKWIRAGRSTEDTDVVLWYSMGHHHIPRPEDWPVMPVGTIGFMLKPNGFFDRNPALDVPPPASHHCSSHGG